MPKIAKRLVDGLRPDGSGKDLFVWDTALKGFGVRMKPSGSAAYLVQYRTWEGRTRRLTIGKVGTLTPEEARAFARERLVDVARGADPSAERRGARHTMTVGELCEIYLSDAVERVKPSTLSMDRSRIETHVKPLIGRRPVTSLTEVDIEQMQAAIAAGKTAKRRAGRGGITTGGRGVAGRTVGMFGTILEFAKRHRLIKENPARGVRRLPDGKQRRFLNFEEIGQLGAAIAEAEARGIESRTGIAAVRFLLLTGLRRMEALALRWESVDTRCPCLRFADTKSGPQQRPIGGAAIELLRVLPRRAGSPWVFPADRGGGHFVGLPKVLQRLCARAELDGVTVHVLRHSFGSVSAEIGFSELTIAGLLGHSVPGITARYAHVPNTALVVAADRVSARIAAALDSRGDVEVIAFSRTA